LIEKKRQEVRNHGLKIEDEVISVIAEKIQREIINDKSTSFFSDYRYNTKHFKSK
jgi:hypothetical protein